MPSHLILASDHGGFPLKEEIKIFLKSSNFLIKDIGVHDETSVDYPQFAHALCTQILDGNADLGILICGTGLGVSMSANRHPGIRAALCTDPYMARMSREHNDANVLCMGARVIGPSLAEEIVKTFLSSEFQGGRHTRRIAQINI